MDERPAEDNVNATCGGSTLIVFGLLALFRAAIAFIGGRLETKAEFRDIGFQAAVLMHLLIDYIA